MITIEGASPVRRPHPGENLLYWSCSRMEKEMEGRKDNDESTDRYSNGKVTDDKDRKG